MMLAVAIASLVLVLSLLGILYFAAKKLPLLLAYPVKEEGNSPKEILMNAFQKLQESPMVKRIASPDILAQNVLSKTRIAAMKTESKTGRILENLRKRSLEKNGNSKFSEDYWRQLKKKRV